MKYTTFGRRTGLRVSEYALGTVNFGTTWSTGASLEDSRAMFERFAEAGGNFIDTADVYQFGQAESFLADFLAADRDHFVVASKYTQGSVDNAGVSRTGNSRKTLVRAIDETLSRLGTDYLDLYWVHWPDTVTPIDEIVSTMDDLVSAGKILHGGFSNFPAWRVARAATIADERGWTSRVVGIQVEYSLVERNAEQELLPMAEALDLGVVLYSPLAGGLLTGKYRTSDQGRLSTWGSVIHREDTAQKSAIVDELLAVSSKLGKPPSQVAIAWLRHRAEIAGTPLVPIIGPRTLAQLDDYLAALDIDLEPEHSERLSAVSTPVLGSPHDDGLSMLDALLGGRSEQFVRPRAVP